MSKKVIFPLIASLALAGGAIGCKASASANIGEPPKPPEPPKVEEPAPPPPEAPKEAAPIKTVGKAKIENNEIKIPGKVHFDFNKSTIKEDAETKEILNTVAQVLKDNPQITKLRIEGHTDDKGGSEFNHKLSQARADAVADWLVKNGIDKSRLVTVGLGEEHPIAKNDTEANREMNRRTEFKLWEIDGKPTDAANAAGAQPAATPAATPAKK